MSKTKTIPEFEISALKDLVEPLSVRVEKIKGTMRTPIALPVGDGSTNTVISGLTRDDITQLENLVFKISGGGIYKAKVTDCNNVELVWSFGWQAPEKPVIPVDDFGAPAPQMQTQRPMGQPSAWASAVNAYPVQGYPMQTPIQGFAAQPAPWGNQFGGMGGGGMMYDPRMQRLEEQLTQERMARQEERHRSELERLRQEFSAKPQGPDPAVQTLREELARERDERRRVEERMERERAEERHRQEMQAIQTQIAALAAAPKGPDPIFEFMRENARAQAEISKEIARTTQAQFERMTALTMNPVQLMEMIEKKSSSVDTTVKGMVDSFGGIMDLQQRVVENLMNLNGPESPAIGLLKDGITTAKEVANRYLRTKEAEKNAAANVEAIKHQSAAVQAQAMAHARAQNVRAANGAGLNGGPAVAPAPVQETPRDAKPTPAPETIPPKPTEAEMFGAAFEHVQRLRMGVRNGLSPDEVVMAIIRGIDFTEANKMEIPAFELVEGGHFQELVELLIPDAPTALKEVVVASLASTYEEDSEEAKEEPEEVEASA